MNSSKLSITNSLEFNDYIGQKPEFQSEESLDPFYKQYDGHEDEEVVIEFWKQCLYEYC